MITVARKTENAMPLISVLADAVAKKGRNASRVMPSLMRFPDR